MPCAGKSHATSSPRGSVAASVGSISSAASAPDATPVGSRRSACVAARAARDSGACRRAGQVARSAPAKRGSPHPLFWSRARAELRTQQPVSRGSAAIRISRAFSINVWARGARAPRTSAILFFCASTSLAKPSSHWPRCSDRMRSHLVMSPLSSRRMCHRCTSSFRRSSSSAFSPAASTAVPTFPSTCFA